MLAVFAIQAFAQQRPDYGPDITIEIAKKVAAGTLAECQSNKWNVAVAVVNTHGVAGVGDQDEQCAKAGLAGM